MITISRRTRRRALVALSGASLLAANGPMVVGYASAQIHSYLINRPSYKRHFGHWQTVELPAGKRVNAVHAALLHTGEVLLMAGSGNSQENFDSATFETLLWNPERNTARLVRTPSDVFCGGHAFLASGRLLIAGGTQRYEVLANNVRHTGGPMAIANVNTTAVTLPHDTAFRAPDGERYLSDVAVTVPPAVRVRTGPHSVRLVHGIVHVWVDAAGRGRQEATGARYAVGAGDSGLYATGGAIDGRNELFQGTNLAYQFDPVAERYDVVEPMAHKRWYPTLTGLADGRVLAVSGLDGTGAISDGHTELFDPRTRTWSSGPVRYFPTYPALFLTASQDLFYPAANAGFGLPRQGRTPGVWNLRTDSFMRIGGLRDAGDNETAASLLLPPAQDQRFMILGGGGVGQSASVTARTAIVDLRAAHPRFTAGPDLPRPTRYPLAVVLPDDTVFVTGGASAYRGEHGTDNHDAEIYDPATNRFTTAASPDIARNYHSEALLLPDGRVATFGSNPLFADANDTIAGGFDQRIEIYSPPYLYRGRRPVLSTVPETMARGASATVTVGAGQMITKLRLIRPGAYTHVTDVETRSVELPFTRSGGALHVSVPRSAGVLPSGWYMLFADNARGVPSVARWVQVG